LFTIGHSYMGFYGMIWAFVLALVLASAFFAFRRNLIPLMIGHGLHNILMRGTAQVSISKNGSLIRVGVLREGDCFGEMSLLTGEPRTATVRAEPDCEVLEISKPVMGALLRSSPQCLKQLSELLAERKLETEGLVQQLAAPEQQAEKQKEYAASFLRRVRSFFEL
jgi:CRP-like cAMP-binding protein